MPQFCMFQDKSANDVLSKLYYHIFDLISQVNVNGKYVGKEREKRAHD